ncbi:ABC transporter substrate-binding protein [Streptosporangium saharense]|uniref:ABC-type nitrate/sulfonate/bicarbonate transport system substrate-binding protein n=1 Tax=Streptosporangium saharense TaxID=1706840 RepID=A0A7W7QK68_9ACTN|nr:ABC transporter substrate-binding protein [Streptosporangium saharense]MBB4915047.1 ABC-type nitrate/sulfonate/bicarbonate transport system substrate-binding protein [Streptosporangium saharense]
MKSAPLRPVFAVAALVVTLALSACSASAGSSAATGAPAADASGAAGTTQLVVGVVPSLELGLLKVAEAKGFLADAGIELKITNVDSGPNVVTGVVAGQYDIGYTAYAPPLLAVAQGQPLKLVSNTSTVGEYGTNGGVLVKKDSGITSFKDLAGKKIGTNAPRSLFSLTVPASIKHAGGDPSGIQLVPLPFAQIGKAVHDGQVDAGVILEPFQTKALAEYGDLTNLGDSYRDILPVGSPGAVYFTSQATATAKAETIKRFKEAVAKTIDYANDHLDEVKAAGGPLAGLTAEQAAKLPLSPFKPQVQAADLDSLTTLMVEFAWIKAKPDLAGFVG